MNQKNKFVKNAMKKSMIAIFSFAFCFLCTMNYVQAAGNSYYNGEATSHTTYGQSNNNETPGDVMETTKSYKISMVLQRGNKALSGDYSTYVTGYPSMIKAKNTGWKYGTIDYDWLGYDTNGSDSIWGNLPGDWQKNSSWNTNNGGLNLHLSNNGVVYYTHSACGNASAYIVNFMEFGYYDLDGVLHLKGWSGYPYCSNCMNAGSLELKRVGKTTIGEDSGDSYTQRPSTSGYYQGVYVYPENLKSVYGKHVITTDPAYQGRGYRESYESFLSYLGGLTYESGSLPNTTGVHRTGSFIDGSNNGYYVKLDTGAKFKTAAGDDVSFPMDITKYAVKISNPASNGAANRVGYHPYRKYYEYINFGYWQLCSHGLCIHSERDQNIFADIYWKGTNVGKGGWNKFNLRNKCGKNYEKGYIGVCADCGGRVSHLVYATPETISSIRRVENGATYLYFCPRDIGNMTLGGDKLYYLYSQVENSWTFHHACVAQSVNQYYLHFYPNKNDDGIFSGTEYFQGGYFYNVFSDGTMVEYADENTTIEWGDSVGKLASKNTINDPSWYYYGYDFDGWAMKDASGNYLKDSSGNIIKFTTWQQVSSKYSEDAFVQNGAHFNLYATWKKSSNNVRTLAYGQTISNGKYTKIYKTEYLKTSTIEKLPDLSSKVSFDFNGGNNVDNISVSNVDILFTGYRYLGQSNGAKAGEFDSTNYIYLNNSKAEVTEYLKGTYSVSPVKLPNASKDGCMFLGWYTTKTGDEGVRVGTAGDEYTPDVLKADESGFNEITLYARYSDAADMTINAKMKDPIEGKSDVWWNYNNAKFDFTAYYKIYRQEKTGTVSREGNWVSIFSGSSPASATVDSTFTSNGTWAAPYSGIYNIVVTGESGESVTDANGKTISGGSGGLETVVIYLEKDDKIKYYVGANGTNSYGQFNGGAGHMGTFFNTTRPGTNRVGRGGAASVVTLVKNGTETVIAVGAGGGGAVTESTTGTVINIAGGNGGVSEVTSLTPNGNGGSTSTEPAPPANEVSIEHLYMFPGGGGGATGGTAGSLHIARHSHDDNCIHIHQKAEGAVLFSGKINNVTFLTAELNDDALYSISGGCYTTPRDVGECTGKKSSASIVTYGNATTSTEYWDITTTSKCNTCKQVYTRGHIFKAYHCNLCNALLDWSGNYICNNPSCKKYNKEGNAKNENTGLTGNCKARVYYYERSCGKNGVHTHFTAADATLKAGTALSADAKYNKSSGCYTKKETIPVPCGNWEWVDYYHCDTCYPTKQPGFDEYDFGYTRTDLLQKHQNAGHTVMHNKYWYCHDCGKKSDYKEAHTRNITAYGFSCTITNASCSEDTNWRDATKIAANGGTNYYNPSEVITHLKGTPSGTSGSVTIKSTGVVDAVKITSKEDTETDDKVAPRAVSNIKGSVDDGRVNTDTGFTCNVTIKNVTFDASVDYGTTYAYRGETWSYNVSEMSPKLMASTDVHGYPEVTATSGVKGYYYKLDKSPTADYSGEYKIAEYNQIESISTGITHKNTETVNETFYLHIFVKDNAGNNSAIVTKDFEYAFKPSGGEIPDNHSPSFGNPSVDVSMNDSKGVFYDTIGGKYYLRADGNAYISLNAKAEVAGSNSYTYVTRLTLTSQGNAKENIGKGFVVLTPTYPASIHNSEKTEISGNIGNLVYVPTATKTVTATRTTASAKFTTKKEVENNVYPLAETVCIGKDKSGLCIKHNINDVRVGTGISIVGDGTAPVVEVSVGLDELTLQQLNQSGVSTKITLENGSDDKYLGLLHFAPDIKVRVKDAGSGIKSYEIKMKSGSTVLSVDNSGSSERKTNGYGSFAVSNGGETTYIVTAYDNVGNRMESEFSVKVDLEVPTIEDMTVVSENDVYNRKLPNSPQTGGWRKTNTDAFWEYNWSSKDYEIKYKAMDMESGIKSFVLYSTDSFWDNENIVEKGTAEDSYTSVLSYTVKNEGTNYFKLVATDNMNRETIVYIIVRVDKTCPGISGSANTPRLENMTIAEANAAISGNVSENFATTWNITWTDSNVKGIENDTSGIASSTLYLYDVDNPSNIVSYPMDVKTYHTQTMQKIADIWSSLLKDKNGNFAIRYSKVDFTAKVNTYEVFPNSTEIGWKVVGVDNVGNTYVYESPETIKNFDVKAVVRTTKDNGYNILSDSGKTSVPYFKTGEVGFVEVWTVGYVEKLELDFGFSKVSVPAESELEISKGIMSGKYKLGYRATEETKRFVTEIGKYRSGNGIPDKNGVPYATHFVYTNAQVNNSIGTEKVSDGWLNYGTMIRIPTNYQLKAKKNANGTDKKDKDGNTLYEWETHNVAVYAHKQGKETKSVAYYVIWDEAGDDLHYRITHETFGF